MKHCTSSMGKMIITVEDASYHVSVSIKETTHNGSLTIVNSSLSESNFFINSFRLFCVSFYIFSINLNSFLLTKITDLSQFFPNFLFHLFLVPLIMNIR